MALVSEKRKQEIKDEVQKLKWKSLDKIAKDEWISYREQNLQDMAEWISWLIMYIESIGKFFIFIEKNDIPTRKRFTMAHELGHYFLHGEKIKESYKAFVDTPNTYTLFKKNDIDVDECDKPMEAEANFFAAELLMPEDVVKEAYKKVKNPEILSEIFMVSLQSMKYRLSNLGLIAEEDGEMR